MKSLLLTIAFCVTMLIPAAAGASRPNVLFIAVDDMKDWVGFMGGYDGEVHTPHLDRLAARGVAFTNAHCAAPVCCPSRTAIMTGLMPSTSGIYNNGQWWKPHMPEVVTIPVQFRNHGYEVAGAGKIFHHTAGNNPPYQWDAYRRLTFDNDPWFRSAKLNYPWSKSGPPPAGFPFAGMAGLPHENDWGSLGIEEAEYDDARTARYAVEFLGRRHAEAFFLACGIFRPHLPWYVPREYFGLYPLDEIELPVVREDDLDDIPAEGRALSEARRSDFIKIEAAGKWKHAVQAYLASISFADAQVGRLLDALDNGGYAGNTIVVLWSDHGWHLGEKSHWHKSTLWEEGTRVPFIFVVPGVARAGERCESAVSLVDIYPTLNELCGLPAIDAHDGESLAALLRNPAAGRRRPAITQYQPGQCAVRGDRYRYIRYADGSEELYDHRSDPHEWVNLAGNPDHARAKAELARWATTDWAEPAPRKNAYRFDPDAFTWTHKQTDRITRGKGN